LKYASIYKYHSVKANSEFLIFLFFLPLGDIYKMMYQAIGVGLILLKKKYFLVNMTFRFNGNH